jgi:RNA polymerase sigma-70 factor (ECF subfamily)
MQRLRCVPAMVRARNLRSGSPLSRDELEDLTQDCLTVIWKKLGDFSGRAPLEGWVYRICVLEGMNAMRAKIRRPRTDSAGIDLTVEDASERREQSLWAGEQIQLAFERLGPPASQLIYLRHMERRTFPELSRLLGTPLDRLKQRYYRGMKKLREILEAMERGEEP